MANHPLDGSTNVSQICCNASFRNYSMATVEDFWEAMANETIGLPADIALSEVMNSWITHRGYPIVSVRRDYDKGTAAVEQVRSRTSKCPFIEGNARVPLVCIVTPNAYRDYSSRQQRFTYEQSLANTQQLTWYVPLDYINGTSDDWSSPTRTWLHPETEMVLSNIGAEDSWIVLNVNKTGWPFRRFEQHGSRSRAFVRAENNSLSFSLSLSLGRLI